MMLFKGRADLTLRIFIPFEGDEEGWQAAYAFTVQCFNYNSRVTDMTALGENRHANKCLSNYVEVIIWHSTVIS